MKILLIVGHPNLEQSVANAVIVEELSKAFPNMQIRKLCEIAPDGKFDIAKEQGALLDADAIIWQFPYHWYSLPWLMKKWLDEVFVHGFAHGSKGKLGGKKFMVSFTTGAPEVAYTGGSGAIGDISKMVEIFAGVANLCKLDYIGAMWLNGVSYIGRDDPVAIASQQDKARDYAKSLIEKIKSMITV